VLQYIYIYIYIYVYAERQASYSEQLPYFYIYFFMNFYSFHLCHLFKVDYRVNLLKGINRLNCSFPKSRDNISRYFSQDSEVVAALLGGFNYLYKVSVYQIKFDWSQASCPIGTTHTYIHIYDYIAVMLIVFVSMFKFVFVIIHK